MRDLHKLFLALRHGQQSVLRLDHAERAVDAHGQLDMLQKHHAASSSSCRHRHVDKDDQLFGLDGVRGFTTMKLPQTLHHSLETGGADPPLQQLVAG